MIQESILPGVVEELVPGANIGGPFKIMFNKKGQNKNRSRKEEDK
jgi:hypothetical protein